MDYESPVTETGNFLDALELLNEQINTSSNTLVNTK